MNDSPFYYSKRHKYNFDMGYAYQTTRQSSLSSGFFPSPYSLNAIVFLFQQAH